MKSRTRIPRRRQKPRVIHPERSGGHLRVRLHGKARQKRRAAIFERAGGRCEEEVLARVGDGNIFIPLRCSNRATEWSHDRHGANKCDCMACGIASCKECHERRHRPKACPPKAAA